MCVMANWTGPQRRGAPRIAITLDLLLLRRRGNRIAGRTVDLGPGGMCVSTDRPLSVDEVVHFDLPLGAKHVEGGARVLRMQGHNTYALRFEELAAEDRDLLTRAVGDTA